MTLQVLQDLLVIYRPLIGANFRAKFIGKYKMPQTGNHRVKLQITRQNPFAFRLEKVSKSVLSQYGKAVWKGITGPEDGKLYTNYCLWVEPGIGLSLEEGHSIYDFKISCCTPFQCDAGSFTHGVSIQVAIEPTGVVNLST